MARTMQHSVSDTRDSKDATFIITAHPDEFRSKEILRTVRSVVMHDYLRKAARDPGTKDRRAIKKALLQRCSRTGNSTVAANESWENMDRNIERPLQYNQMVDSSDWLNVISPAIGPSFAQNEMAALATSLQELTLSEDAKSCNTRIAPFINRMRRKRLTVRMPFMMQQSYGRDEVCESGENNINMPLLKIISGAYFASRACNQQWIPLVLQTPEAYLSCLCIVAPYADVFMAGKDADRITLSQFKQTLAITSVVSRMIKDRLNKPEHLGDDQTILAVMQLLNSQMAAPFGDTIQAHQDALGNLIRLRGGLSCLGGDGTIARMAVMVDYEISVVRNELVKPVYAAWMRSYLRNILPKACNTKGNPLLRIGLDNKNEYGIKDRSHEIVALLQAVHRLTDAANMVENEARKTDETRDVAAASLELREAI
ncbi:Hypothetical protein D9617_5g069960 [Elsinoe fawcettii]|nr:Hypothetical protein D9617_5g069960 [Elsinoe fawcettii]